VPVKTDEERGREAREILENMWAARRRAGQETTDLVAQAIARCGGGPNLTATDVHAALSALVPWCELTKRTVQRHMRKISNDRLLVCRDGTV
jgi:hypothetical protein